MSERVLEWRHAAGDRYLAEAPVGDASYEVFAAYVAFTCDMDGAYDGGWLSDEYAERAEALGALASAYGAGMFPFIRFRDADDIELYVVRPGLDAAFGDGRGVAVALDWQAYLGDVQIGAHASLEEAMEACEADARMSGAAGK